MRLHPASRIAYASSRGNLGRDYLWDSQEPLGPNASHCSQKICAGSLSAPPNLAPIIFCTNLTFKKGAFIRTSKELAVQDEEHPILDNISTSCGADGM